MDPAWIGHLFILAALSAILALALWQLTKVPSRDDDWR